MFVPPLVGDVFHDIRQSMQTHAWPSGLGTTTIPTHHSVGTSTLAMTPSCCIRHNLFHAFLSNGTATRLGTDIANGLVCDLSLITYSPRSLPSPVSI